MEYWKHDWMDQWSIGSMNGWINGVLVMEYWKHDWMD